MFNEFIKFKKVLTGFLFCFKPKMSPSQMPSEIQTDLIQNGIYLRPPRISKHVNAQENIHKIDNLPILVQFDP